LKKFLIEFIRSLEITARGILVGTIFLIKSARILIFVRIIVFLIVVRILVLSQLEF